MHPNRETTPTLNVPDARVQAQPQTIRPNLGNAHRRNQDEAQQITHSTYSLGPTATLAEMARNARRMSEAIARISGPLVAGADAGVVRLDYKTGKTSFNVAETYLRLRDALAPDNIRSQSIDLRTNGKPGEATRLALLAPQSRTFMESPANSVLKASAVFENANSPDVKLFAALNSVTATGGARPVFQQARMQIEEGGSVRPVYGFKKSGEDPEPDQFMGVVNTVTSKGERAIQLVSAVYMQAHMMGNGQNEIKRLPKLTDAIPIETTEQQLALAENLKSQGWEPIHNVPPQGAGMPMAARGFSEVNFTANANTTLAKAVAQYDVMQRGYHLALNDDQNMLKGKGGKDLPPLIAGLVQDYAHVARMMKTDVGFSDAAVEALFEINAKSLRAYADLQKSADKVRFTPDAMPVIRMIATEECKAKGVDPKAIYPTLDNPNRVYHESVPAETKAAFAANGVTEAATKETLAKWLTEKMEPNAPRHLIEGQVWPDGSPRFVTKYDQALQDDINATTELRDNYNKFLNQVASASTDMIGIRIANVGTFKGKEIPVTDASPMAKEYNDHRIFGAPIDNRLKSMIDEILKSSGTSKLACLRELELSNIGLVDSAIASRLTPDQIKRDRQLVGEIITPRDPVQCMFRPYQVQSVNAPPDARSTVFIVPENSLPENFDPRDKDAVAALFFDEKNRDAEDAEFGEEGNGGTLRFSKIEIVEEQGIGIARPTREKMTLNEALKAYQAATNCNDAVKWAYQPLSERMSTGQALAHRFNHPVTEVSLADGRRQNMAIVAFRIENDGVGSPLAKGDYSVYQTKTKPMIRDTEPYPCLDERRFVNAVGGVDKAKAILKASDPKNNPNLAGQMKTLDSMASPRRQNGMYEVRTTPEGIEAFRSERAKVLEAMAAVKMAKADAEQSGPEGRKRAYADIEDFTRCSARETTLMVSSMYEAIKNKGVIGYSGPGAPHGVIGNSVIRPTEPIFTERVKDANSLARLPEKWNLNGQNCSIVGYKV